MAAETKRRAKIIDVNDHTITLQITGDCSDSCQGCRLQIVCHNSSGADSLLTVARDCYAGPLDKGDTVEISAAGSSQLTAAALLFGVPALLLIGALAGLPAAGFGDGASVAVAVTAVAAWYCVVAALKKRFDRQMKWIITKA